MADGGFASSYLPALSRLLGEVESPTNTQQMMSPQFGGSPEQLMQFLQSPHMQHQMGQFGVQFDPSQLRQSPFFPNQFMQAHPQLGGFLNRGMASMATTPEAPLVSGFGSGLSRFAQGAAGGPEMLRQFQIRQMMAPFQAMGAQIPGMEFQRKEQLLQLLQKMEEDRMAQSRSLEQAPRYKQVPGGTEVSQYSPGQQAGGTPLGSPQGSGFDMIQTGARPPITSLSPGMEGQQVPMPGYGLTPEQQAGWGTQFIPEQGSQVELRKAQAGQAQAGAELKTEQAKTEPSKRDLNKAKAEQARASAGLAKTRSAWQEFNNRFAAGHGGLKPGDLEKYGRDYTKLEQDTTKQIQALQRASQLPKGSTGYVDPATAAQQITELNRIRELGKSTFDKARNAPGASGMVAPQGMPQPNPSQPTSQNPYPNQ